MPFTGSPLGTDRCHCPTTFAFAPARLAHSACRGLVHRLGKVTRPEVHSPGTGARVTAVELDQRLAVESRTALEDIMAPPAPEPVYQLLCQARGWGQATRLQLGMMRKYSGVQDQARKYAKQKREMIGIQQCDHVSLLAAARSRRARTQVPPAAAGRLAGHAAVVNPGARACEKWENERESIDPVMNEPAATQ